jgi:general secretion pathway protein A
MIRPSRMYERFFHLRDQPFRLTPDPAYLFLGTKHREGFAHLLFAMRDGNGFVAVTGEVGTGKTTLVRALLAETQNDNIAVCYIFNPVLTPVELLQTINAEFGLPARSNSKKQLTDTLNRFLVAQEADGGRAVVIVDEAQNLDREVLEQLRLLSNLETETQKLMQIILLGQPELRELLDRPDMRQLSQRVTIRWHLDALDRQETQKYVRHRLAVAGAKEGLFDAKAIDVLHDHAAGIPRLINIIAHRALLVAFSNGRDQVGANEVAAAAAELGQSRIPIHSAPRTWVYKAAAGTGVAMAAGVVALLLVLPLRDDGPNAAREGAARAEKPAETGTAKREKAAEPAPNPVELERVEKRIAATDAFSSIEAAIARLVELWSGTKPNAAEFAGDTLDMEALGAKRGLSYVATRLPYTTLLALDLPTAVELRTGEGEDTRIVVIEGASERMVTLYLSKPLSLSQPTFERMWTGASHIYWRDGESLRGNYSSGAEGPEVARLQALLMELGALKGPASANYDEGTEEAVKTVQKSYGIPVTGEADALTQIIIYNAVARIDRPALGGGRSKAPGASG